MKILSCPGCDSSHCADAGAVKDHDSGERFHLSRCTRCELQFLRDPPIPADLRSYYGNEASELMHQKPSRLFSAMQKIRLRKDSSPLLDSLHPGARILDFGAGDGSMSRYLASRGFQVMAMDSYDPAAWPESKIPYRRIALERTIRPEDLRIDGASVEAIIFRHVLEHVFDPFATLKSVREAGIRHVLIILPNNESRLCRAFGSNWFYWDPPRHLTHFGRTSIEHMAARAGFTVTRQGSYGIDEIVTSGYRRRRLAGHRQDLLTRLLSPKGVLAGASSALSTPFANTTYWCVLESKLLRDPPT